MNFSLGAWLTFAAVLLGLLSLDMLSHRGGRGDSTRAAVAWTVAWVLVGVGFSGFVAATCCRGAAGEYLAAYFIEKSLSLDNLFVFLIVFRSLKIPEELQRTALTWGVLGALLFRALFVAAGVAAVERLQVVTYLFAGILLLAAWRSLRAPGAEQQNRLVEWLLRVLPVSARTFGRRFLVRLEGRWLATPLLVAIVGLELTDVVFAVDSVPAAFSVTDEPFLIYSSNVFAILGLRSLYLVLAATLVRLIYLHYALAAILAFAGAKILAAPWLHVPEVASIAFIIGAITVASWSSVRAGRGNGARGEPAAGTAREGAPSRASDG